TKEQIDEEESRALTRINETPVEKAAKRQKMDEDVEELKRHLQIVPNEEDDVYTEATPLALKVKEKQEKDKIRTKPDENGKRGKAQQCRRPITVEKAEKEDNTKLRDQICKS
nr:hypothetical protein [Tanacetum cinerariifolium]